MLPISDRQLVLFLPEGLTALFPRALLLVPELILSNESDALLFWFTSSIVKLLPFSFREVPLELLALFPTAA
ncbi:MAG TPA: hypothetical protein VFA93_03420 [Patescibacteria group bacterium]|nr:hypothetical protein [Patescibacteria group bacterium]